MPGSAAAGTVSGHVTLVDSNNSAVKRKKDYSDVVVWLTAPGSGAARPPGKRVEMLQKDKTFSPHILVVPKGTKVDFPNLDPIFHNAFSSFDGQIFRRCALSPRHVPLGSVHSSRYCARIL